MKYRYLLELKNGAELTLSCGLDCDKHTSAFMHRELQKRASLKLECDAQLRFFRVISNRVVV